MYKITLLFLFILFLGATNPVITATQKRSTAYVTIIPKPNLVTMQSGKFILPHEVKLGVASQNSGMGKLAGLLSEELKNYSGLTLTISENDNAPDILLKIDEHSESLGDEGYLLTVSENGIILEAKAPSGLFYATQSLIQLISAAKSENGHLALEACRISDYPRYPWRGMHLDVSRHFFPKEFILKYLDAMAMHKLNVFHWHLTDDQGWRVEIKKYPKLTDIGAWREDQEDRPWNYFQYPSNDRSKKLYGGFYTQDDVRAIVAYAAERNILIVPEIDVPGHSTAAIYAYPELNCSKKIWTKDPVIPFEFSDPLCAGNDFTYQFIEDVFTELCELFPGPYFHIGGDECKHTPWETCSACQKRIKENKLKDEKELQSYFNQRLEIFLATKQKRLIGWEEIAEGGISPSSILMSWKGEEAGIVAARKKLQVIMVPSGYLYFDRNQEPSNAENDLTLETVYGYNPDPAMLNPADCRYIMGVEAALWSEHVFDTEMAEKQLLPRLCALSEVAWTMPENKDYADFQKRMFTHYRFLEKSDLNYHVSMPVGLGKELVFTDRVEVELKNSFGKGDIYYTTDGSEPDEKSSKYSKVLFFKQSCLFKARTIVSANAYSKTLECKIIRQPLEPSIAITGLASGLNLKYYEGIIDSLSHWQQLSFVKSGTSAAFSIPEFAREDSFGIVLEGYIQIDEDGIYTFSTASDDGTWLFINDSLLVNNDGCHGPVEISKQKGLKKGFHRIRLHYFEALYGNALMVYISSKTLPHQLVPASMLFRKP